MNVVPVEIAQPENPPSASKSDENWVGKKSYFLISHFKIFGSERHE